MRPPRSSLLLVGVWLGYVALSVLGAAAIPFHPDESSLLYQSRDLELLFSDPLELAWGPQSGDDPQAVYRALNAPLGKYWLALGRLAAGYGSGSVSADWDWSETWEENVARGALPPQGALRGARAAMSVMTALAVALLYQTGRRLGGRLTGVLAAAIFALDPLVLLHGRRAMLEGALLFGITAASLGLICAYRRPIAAAFGSALALGTKYSGLAVIPAGVMASIWPDGAPPQGIRIRLMNAFKHLLALVALIWVSHPILWRQPMAALQAMWGLRSELVQAQADSLRGLRPEFVLNSLPERGTAMLAHLYFTPLQFFEYGNYLEATAAEQQAYLAIPFHGIARGGLGGSIRLALTLVGGLFALLKALRVHDVAQRRNLSLVALAAMMLAASLLVANPLPIQRYYLPLTPFLALFAGMGLDPPLREVLGRWFQAPRPDYRAEGRNQSGARMLRTPVPVVRAQKGRQAGHLKAGRLTDHSSR
jgi:hypothetical protein